MATLIVPWRETEDLWRLAGFGAVRALRSLEGYDFLIAQDSGEGPWVKANPFWQALQGRDPDEVVAMHDADVWCSHYELDDAFRAVTDGEAEWALPHRKVYRLNPTGTRRLCNGAPVSTLDTEQDPYDGIPGGGIVVAQVATLLDTPLDALFVGWGQEDECWGAALTTLHGEPYRGKADLVHLWHEPQERMTRTRGSLDNWLRKVCYCEAAGDPARMRGLVERGKSNLQAAEPALHDHA